MELCGTNLLRVFESKIGKFLLPIEQRSSGGFGKAQTNFKMEYALEPPTSQLLNMNWEDIYGILIDFGERMKAKPDVAKQTLIDNLPVLRAFYQAQVEAGVAPDTPELLLQLVETTKQSQIMDLRQKVGKLTREEFLQLPPEAQNQLNVFRQMQGLPIMS